MFIDINEEYKHMGWGDVIGNEKAVHLLTSMSTIPQVGLFSGPIGCGKNLLAYLLYKRIAETGHTMLSVRDSADSKAETAMNMIEQFKSVPLGYKNSVVILNEFHSFLRPAQGKFVDILQAPPKKVYFFIVSLEPGRIIPDIKSRCKFHIKVKKLSKEEMSVLVNNLVNYHNLSLNKKMKFLIIDSANGVPRAAVNMVNSIACIDNITMDTVVSVVSYNSSYGQEGTAFYSLYRLVTASGTPSIFDLQKLPKLIEETKLDPVAIQYKMLDMCYRNFSNKKILRLLNELVPDLSYGKEKYDLLNRLGRVMLY